MNASNASSTGLESLRHQIASAIDSPTVAALANVFSPRNNSLAKSYSEQITEILLPRFAGVAQGSPNRDAIARLVDPHAFKSWQGLYDYCLRDETRDFAKRCADSFHGEAINEALAKADAILALSPQPASNAYAAPDPLSQEVENARVNRVADRIAFLDEYWPDWREDGFTQRYIDVKAAFDAGWKVGEKYGSRPASGPAQAVGMPSRLHYGPLDNFGPEDNDLGTAFITHNVDDTVTIKVRSPGDRVFSEIEMPLNAWVKLRSVGIVELTPLPPAGETQNHDRVHGGEFMRPVQQPEGGAPNPPAGDADAEAATYRKLIKEGIECVFDDSMVTLFVSDESVSSVGLDGGLHLSISCNYEVVPVSLLRDIKQAMGGDGPWERCVASWQQAYASSVPSTPRATGED